MNYPDLISQERAKLKLLTEKVERCKKRIVALEILASSEEEDALDEALHEALVRDEEDQDEAVLSVSLRAAQRIMATSNHRYIRKNSIAPKILTFLSTGKKSLDEVENHIPEKSRGNLVTLLWNLKNKGLVSNPTQGSYAITSSGLEIVEEYKKQSGLDESASKPLPDEDGNDLI